MVGRRKILLRLLHPEGYTGCTADTIIKELSISFFQQKTFDWVTNTWPQQKLLPTKNSVVLPVFLPLRHLLCKLIGFIVL